MTNLDSLNADFKDMVEALCTEGAAFIIVGAYAVSFHGHPRTTGDIDLLIRPDPANATRVWAALRRFGAPVIALGITEDELCKTDMVFQLGVPPRRIDLLTTITGVEFEAAWRSRVEVAWRSHSVAFLGLGELVQNKRATGRPKDQLDVDELLRLPGRDEA